MHAQLADADLSGARLQRANLSQAKLDGARLSGADLSFTSLRGASLRGADLRGARLEGTDLRQTDLSGAQLSPGALSRAHWQGARGVDQGLLSFGELHNAGVEAAQKGRFPEAEQWFSAAIRREPAAGVSWLARGITRSQMGRRQEASNDFAYAASLYEAAGDDDQAAQLRQAAEQAKAAPDRPAGRWQRHRLDGPRRRHGGLLQFLATAGRQGLPAPALLKPSGQPRSVDSPRPAGHLVLAGGGHTHALVLLGWAMAAARRRNGSRGAMRGLGRGAGTGTSGLISLVSRASSALYSGMVPGLLAGLYDRDACSIDLRRLCELAGVTFIAAEITGLEAVSRTLVLAGRPPLRWDWLSLDVGSETAVPACEPAMAVKPLEPFLDWAETSHSQSRDPSGHQDLAIRGGGAAAVEVALALRGRGRRPALLLRGQQLHLGSRAANRLGEGAAGRGRHAGAAPGGPGRSRPCWPAPAAARPSGWGRRACPPKPPVDACSRNPHSRCWATRGCSPAATAP